MGLVEGRAGVGTVVAEGVAKIAKGRQREAVFERARVLVRDAAALGITEDDLWESLDSEFERIPRGEAVITDTRVERYPSQEAVRDRRCVVNDGHRRAVDGSR
jgi:hypothetical protein